MGKSSRRSRRRGGSYDRERCRKKPPPTTRTLSSQPKYDCFFDDCDKTFVCWGDCNKHLKGFHHVTDMRGVQQLCSRKLDMKYSLPFPSKRDDVVNASSDIHLSIASQACMSTLMMKPSSFLNGGCYRALDPDIVILTGIENFFMICLRSRSSITIQ